MTSESQVPPGRFSRFHSCPLRFNASLYESCKIQHAIKHSAQKIPPDSQEKPQGFTEIPLSFVGFFVFIVVVI